MNSRLGSIVTIPTDDSQLPKSEQSANVIKFGVTSVQRDGQGGELLLLQPHESILDAVKQLCDKWGFPDPAMYALRFGDADKIGHYVIEESRKQLTGKIVAMDFSAVKISLDVIEKLQTENTMLEALKDLANRASDPTLAETFIETNGLACLVELIERDRITQEQALLYTFQAFLDIIFSSTSLSWDQMPASFFSKVATYVNTPKGVNIDRLALKPALQILESAISCENAASQRVESEITLPNLINHISHPDAKVQLSSLSLINTLLQKADVNKRKHLTATLNSRKYRSIVHEKVICRSGEMLTETRHELYVLQTLLLSLLEERKLSPVDQDSETLNRIKDLCHTPPHDHDSNHINSGSTSDLVNSGSTKKEKPNFSKDYKRLGFQNDVIPAQDFREIPPGILALDCMHYLAKQHSDTYNKLVLECGYRNSGEEIMLPFARASIQLTKVLADLLKIGEQPSELQGKFYPFYFTHDKPFEELFCVCLQLVLKTWKEMRATPEDFQKVFDVVREQIRRSLDIFPESFSKLQAKLNTLTFAEITSLRARERSSREEGELQLQPIQDLQNKLMPEILELIRQNRMNFLINGTRFNKFTSKSLVSASATTLKRVKEKYWFCRLSSNWKVLHYGDCEEKANPAPEELANKINIVDLKELLVGKECPHTKEKKNRNLQNAFSLVIEKEPLQSIDFIAPDEKVFDMWTDGINALLGKAMSSKEAKNDTEILLKMEVKLRLLDIEGIDIPNDPPPIPPPPPNYDFSVLLK